jgi:hypothetical protein
LNKLGYFTLALLLYGTGVDAGCAQDADAAQRAFVERYVAALRSQDSADLRILHHPASLACSNPQNRDYYDFMFAKELRHGAGLRGGYTLTRFEPVDADTATALEMGGLIPNPVQPTHQFQIDTPFDNKNHSLTILRMAAEHAGTWFIVLGCPTDKAIGLFRERRAEGERQQARARQLAGDLQEPLRSEIKDLLAQNRRIDAVKRYQSGANTDLTTATQVIDILAGK